MDPFTVVTGSAGLLSTSITVCHGLISYCRSYRSREEDLSVLRQNAERLKSYLQLLENRYQTAPSMQRDFRDAVNECIIASGKCLDEFGQLSDKYSPPSTGSAMQSRRQVFGGRLRYPFQKDKFESFRQQIHGLNFLLLGYMEVLNHDLNSAMRDESRAQTKDLASLVFDGTEGIKSHIDTALPDLARKLETELSKTGDALTLRLDSVQSTLENFIKDGQILKNGLEKPLQPVSQPEFHDGSHGMTGNSTVAGQTMNLSPSQASCLASQWDSTSSKAAGPHHLISLNPSSGGCDCFKAPRRLQARGKPCPHTHLRPNRRILSGELRVFSYLVQVRVAIEYSQEAFLDNLQIQPNLTVRATVPSDSPAFSLVGDIVQVLNDDRYSSEEEFRHQVRNCLRNLKDLFSRGEAWPTDIDVQGDNLMQVAAYRVDAGRLQPNMVQTYSDFLEGLAHLRVPIDQSQSTIAFHWICICALDDIFQFHEARLVVCMQVLMRTLARLGADLWDTWDLEPGMSVNPGPHILKLLGQDMLGQHHSIGYPDLSHALLQRSEAKTRELLSAECGEDLVYLLQERGPWDHTPLHVSTSWPQGMQLMFELAGEAIKNVISIQDSVGKTALDYAVDLGEIDSVKQLVTSGHAQIDLESGRGFTLFRLQQPRRSQEELAFLAHILADRRRQLHQLASQTLESFERVELRMASSNAELILQENSFDVVRQLQASGIDIPQIFRHIRPSSIYHSLYAPSVELLDALYQAGFTHTNVTYFGFCPLMTIMHQAQDTRGDVRSQNSDETIALLQSIIWFRDHGVDLYRPIPQIAIHGSPCHQEDSRQFRLIHQLSEQLGHFLVTALTSDNDVEEQLLSMLRELVLSLEIDPCTCFCSPKGCTAISLLARQSHYEHIERKIEACGIVESLDPNSDATFRVISNLVRLMTFEKLEMSHTCCKYDHDTRSNQRVNLISMGKYRFLKLMDSEEIAEIQEEDRHLSVLLEDVVFGFEEQYRSSGGSFREFLMDHWMPRIAELDAEEEGLSPEDEDAIHNIGVILHNTR